MHVYTYSGKDILVVPEGNYDIKIYKNPEYNNPIVVRVSRISRQSKDIIKEEINISNNDYRLYNGFYDKYSLKSINKSFMPLYHLLEENNPLFLTKNNEFMEFYLRGLHDTTLESPRIVRMILEKNGKYDTKYHVFCVPHKSKVINENKKIASKLNKIYIQNNNNYYEFKLDTIGSELLFKLNRLLN